MHVGRALRHAEDIEQRLVDAGVEKMMLGGPMPPVMQIGRFGGHFFADWVYVIAGFPDGRIERMDGGDYKQTLVELLPEDGDVVLTVFYPIFAAADATLYTVPREPQSGPEQGSTVAIR